MFFVSVMQACLLASLLMFFVSVMQACLLAYFTRRAIIHDVHYFKESHNSLLNLCMFSFSRNFEEYRPFVSFYIVLD